MHRISALLSIALVGSLASPAAPAPAPAPSGDPAVISRMTAMNQQLAARGLHIAVEAIDFITIGNGRPSNRIHQEPFRWVAGDARRLADGTKITYLVDQSDGATTSGLTNAQTEAAIDGAMHAWQTQQALNKVTLVKRPDSGADPDLFDALVGFGEFGDPFVADIVEAGWLPAAFFDAVGGSGASDHIIAFSISFIFDDDNGNPTDINGDHYLDTALNEVYYNDNFGNPGGNRAAYPWGIGRDLPYIDTETVALHENGHSLGIGHFGPPPAAVMNPVYAGIRISPLPIDHAGMASVWGSWPK